MKLYIVILGIAGVAFLLGSRSDFHLFLLGIIVGGVTYLWHTDRNLRLR